MDRSTLKVFFIRNNDNNNYNDNVIKGDDDIHEDDINNDDGDDINDNLINDNDNE